MLLPLDDCLYALQSSIPSLIRSSLHRYFQCCGISRLPEISSDKPAKKKFAKYPIGYFHIDIADPFSFGTLLIRLSKKWYDEIRNPKSGLNRGE